MFILFLCLIIVCALIVCTSIILSWRYYSDNSILPRINSLRQYNALSKVWPDDSFFLSLHFKILRYALLGTGVLLITWFVKISWIIMVSRFVVLLFFMLSIPLQRARTYDWKDASNHSRELLKAVRRACTFSFFYPLVVFAILMVAYGFRP